ncbi:sensor histidine kinase [Halovenus halobia]|uniref:sensor histidine kinase n=1 Tax=Halovenus halobia TaxID=3396622 RepID=UPI003F574F89
MALGKRWYAVLLAGLGAGLLSFVFFDIYEDWQGQGEALWLTLAENSLPLLLAGGIVAGSLWLYRNRDQPYLTLTFRWAVVGAAGILLIYGWALGLQSFQSRFKPLVIAVHTAIGGALAGGGIGYTIAYIRESRNEIETERNRWQSLFDNDPNGIVDLTLRAESPVVDAANEQFIDLFGVSDPEGKSLSSIVKYTDEELPTLTNAIQQGNALSTEFTTTIDGERRHLTAQVVPYSADSESKAFVLYTDITDLRETQADLEEQMKQLEKSNERLQQFAYIASHDLQEPLRMVSSYMSLLESEYSDELDEDAQEYIDFAADGANRMQDMIDELLAYSRVRTEGEEFTETDANEVLTETLQSLELRIDESGATVTSDDLPRVEADRSQLGQLFQNLISNAIDHADAPTIHVSSESRGDDVVFSVEDNGPGIPESQQEGVFELFKRGDRDGDGTGMGLAICDRIVSRHGGEIWVDSEEGEGATFSFSMPRA